MFSAIHLVVHLSWKITKNRESIMARRKGTKAEAAVDSNVIESSKEETQIEQKDNIAVEEQPTPEPVVEPVASEAEAESTEQKAEEQTIPEGACDVFGNCDAKDAACLECQKEFTEAFEACMLATARMQPEKKERRSASSGERKARGGGRIVVADHKGPQGYGNSSGSLRHAYVTLVAAGHDNKEIHELLLPRFINENPAKVAAMGDKAFSDWVLKRVTGQCNHVRKHFRSQQAEAAKQEVKQEEKAA